MTNVYPPTALEVIMDNLPVDDADGQAFIGMNADGSCQFGPPEQVAVKILDALRTAGMLDEHRQPSW